MSLSGAATGAATGAGIGSIIPGIGTLIGGGIGGLIGLFKGGSDSTPSTPATDDLTNAITGLKDASSTVGKQGAQLTGGATDQLAPILNYFKQLTGNNPSAILDATKPDRGRVIDQYDSARRAISNFAPRGGASSDALASSYTSEANQLSDITSTARSTAIGQSASLGTTLEGLGLSAEQLQGADLNTVVNAILGQKGLDLQASGQNKQLAAGLSEGLGMLLGLFLTRDGGLLGKKAA